MCVISKTKNAWACYDWYQKCDAPHPHVEYKHGCLHMQMVKAIPVCVSSSANAVTQIFAQVDKWSKVWAPSGTWQEYVTSIQHRCFNAKALAIMRSVDYPMSTFCHGDLTLENVLVNHKSLYYIDPNPGKFSSHWLDLGKLAFSLEYHERFNSYWLAQSIRERLLEYLNPTVLKPVLVSHIVRLQGYQPQELIEEWLSCVCS